MRKAILLSATLLVACATAQAGLQVNWGTFDAASLLFDSGGNPLSSEGLVIQLVLDLGDQNDFATMISNGTLGIGSETQFGAVDSAAVDDITVSGSDFAWLADGWVYDVSTDSSLVETATPSNQGADFYFRWFNATSIGTATEAGIIYSDGSGQVWQTPLDATGGAVSANAELAFSQNASGGVLGSVNGGSTGWATVAAVPEPGMLGLLAVGLMTLVARRKRKA
jgi:hypothetical protein